ncbi:MAG: MTAP family purine nucleoside phosphorylase [Firmicutes bacterium]|jgi:5'-methylthioadenosine phosphorylase|nr:MTAP family purine nucleoside phosphorylase [Bacillota bacterium]
MAVGLIIGTGVDARAFVEEPRFGPVRTPWGEAEVARAQAEGCDVVMVRRHGAGHSIPPHRINYRANIAALKELGVTHVLATSAVGSVNRNMAPGDFCVLSDFLDFTRTRPFTFFEGEDGRVIHTDMSRAYCSGLREVLLDVARGQGLRVHAEACYACVEGPRYETPAEVKALAMLGADVVGMTNATEALLCREAGLCFGTLALVTNWGAGIGPERLDHEQVTQEVLKNTNRLVSTLRETLRRLCERPVRCDCGVTGV